jgi:HK97 family phage prohead protease
MFPLEEANMSRTIERRLVDASLEIRTADDGTIGLRGYAAVFDSPAHGEVVKRSAFNRTLAQRDDVRLLVNHEGVPLARTKSGTMRLSVDDRGLVVEVDSLDPSNPTVQELVSAMSRGDVDQMSFAFADVNPTRNSEGVRELREVILYDVSVVTYPWYDMTSVGLTGDRDMDRALVSLRSLSPDQRAKVIAGLDAVAGDDGGELLLAARRLSAAKLAARTAPAGEMSWSDRADAVCAALEAEYGSSCFIEDIGDDWVVYVVYPDWGTYLMASWSIDADGAVTIGEPTQVTETYVPVVDPAAADTGRSYTIAEARALLAPTAA